MSVFSSLWSSSKDKDRGDGSVKTVTLDALDAEDYVIDRLVDDIPGMEFAIAVPRSKARSQIGLEFGNSSPSPFTSWIRQEYNRELVGLRGLQKYDKMRKSDGTVRGSLRALKTPTLSGRWYCQPYCEIDATSAQKEAWEEQAHFIWHTLTCMKSISWTQILIEATLCLDFGYFMFEKVWDTIQFEGETRTTLVKLAPRHPMDVKEWIFDQNGGPQGVVMYTTVSDLSPLGEVYIPIEKLLVFTYDREGGDITGVSALRSAYKHWYYKEQLYKIDAIQKERHGIGIPVIKLPLGYKDEDKVIADELGRNIRTNERAHVVLPPNWEIVMLKLEGQPVDPMDSIDHHDDAIRENMGTNFIVQGAREDDLVMFFRTARYLANLIAETFTTYVVPQIMQYNWPDEEYYPKVCVRGVGTAADWRTLSFAIRNLVGAGVFIPDMPLEENLREEMDLPDVDKDTARLIATPQNPYDQYAPKDQSAPNAQDQLDQTDSGGGGNDIHNNQNPLYDRGQRRISRNKRKARQGQLVSRKNAGMRAGLPRQTAVNQQRGQNSNGGRDRSGG